MRSLLYSILLFFLVSIFCYQKANAAVSNISMITGTVTDAATGAPLQGATIFIHEIKQSAVSDANGVYHFATVPNGSFTFEVTHIGYRPVVKHLLIMGNATPDFQMIPTVVEGENITVIGVATASGLRNVPAHISVITQKDLERAAGTTLLDAVAKSPGVSIVTTGPAVAKPFIRGLGYNRVVTINDGVRQEGQQWGDEHDLEVDEYSARRVEVLRGPASLMYGSDAIGGVINIITHTPAPDNIIRATITGTVNTNNRMWGQNANVQGSHNGISWNAYGSFKNAGDYKNRFDGGVLNSRFNEKNFGGYMGINKRWGFSHIIYSNFNQQLGMVEGERDDNGNMVLDGFNMNKSLRQSRQPLVPYQLVKHNRLIWDNLLSLKNGGRITALAAIQQNKRGEYGNPEAPTDPGAFLTLKTLTYNTAYHLPAADNTKAGFGISGMHQGNRNTGAEAIIPDYDLIDGGLYVYASHVFDKVTLSGGLRYDHRDLKIHGMLEDADVKFATLKKSFSNISASIGINHEVNERILLKANISRGFRAPNVTELSANGEHEGTGRYEKGNAALKSETSFSLDGGIQFITQHVDMNISLFRNALSNYIYQQKIRSVTGGDSLIKNSTVYKFEQQNAKLAGIEAGLDIHPHPLDWLHFENTFSFVRGKFSREVDGSDNLPLIAPAQLLTELRAEFPNVYKTVKNLYAKFEMDNVFTQNKFFSGYSTETATKGYMLLNAGVGADIFSNKKRLASVIISVNNITDKAYQSHLSRLKYLEENPAAGRVGVFNMGRNITARLIFPFEWNLK